MDDRLTICNMAIEAGAKNGIFPVDDKTHELHQGPRTTATVTGITRPTRTPSTTKIIEIDLSALRPTVAFPHLPENTKTIDEVGDM